jgi:[ribosomal protein S18]-alanine N-acetyltransferase
VRVFRGKGGVEGSYEIRVAEIMNEILIRSLETQTDAEICARLMAETEPWVTLKRDYQASLDTILHTDKEVFVAVDDDQIIGFIILNMHGALVGYIQSVCVVEKFRGYGIGSKLMEFAEDRIFTNHPNAFIMVSSFNEHARRLYEKRGYKVIGELDNLIIEGHSEYILRKTR